MTGEWSMPTTFPRGDVAGHFGDGQTRAEADLQHPVRGLYIKQGHHPQIALPVGAAVRHHPFDQPAGHALRPAGLAHEIGDQALFHQGGCHGASQRLQVRLKSRCPRNAPLRG
jgi:hypothetical protein